MAKCEKPGCRAPARRGESYCRWHSPKQEGRLSPWGLYERFFTADEIAALQRAGDNPGLEAEIALARVAIMRLLEDEENAGKLIDGIAKAVTQIVRAMKMEHVISGSQAEDLLEATNRVLAELGFGPEEG